MNDPSNGLQALWDDQPENLTIHNMKELTMSLEQDHREEQKRLFFLNVQEVTPAIGLFLWTLWQGLSASTNAWAWFGAALMSFFVGAFLVTTSLRQRQRESTLDNTSRGELERSLSQMEHRAWLYRNVAWWYLLPVAVAVVLMLVANEIDFAAPGALVYLAVAAGGLGLLYRWNRKVGREQYEPKVERLSRLIADLG